MRKHEHEHEHEIGDGMNGESHQLTIQGRQPVALVVGYTGGINVGDEAIVAVMARQLRDVYGCRVVIASGQPSLTNQYMLEEFEIVQAFYPGPGLSGDGMQALNTQIKQSDMIVFAGGGLMQDVHSTNLLEHCAYIASKARMFNKHVFAFGIGAGPVTSQKGIALARLLCDCCDEIYFRDTYSLEYMENNVLQGKSHAQVGFDTILLASLGTKNDGPATDKVRKIGLSVRHWKNFGLEQVTEVVKSLVEAGSRVVYMAYEKKDLLMYEELKSQFGEEISLSDESTIESTFSTISELDGLVSMRLHANLFAILAGVPFVALAYDNKLKTVIGSLGKGSRVLPLEASTTEMLSVLDEEDKSDPAQLQRIVGEHEKNLTSMLEKISSKPASLSVGQGISHRYYWYKQRQLLPFLRKVSMNVGPTLGKLIPSALKTKIKRMIGINW